MNAAHGFNQLVLGLWAGHNVKFAQEIVSHRNQGISGPALEPVHGAARDQPWELEGSLPELLSHLLHKSDFYTCSQGSGLGTWGLFAGTSLPPVTQR